MSVRARIGVMNSDGRIVSIHNHRVGYPSFLGKNLRESYGTLTKVQELIKMGDAAIIGTELGTCELTQRLGMNGIFTDEFKQLSDDEQRRLRTEYYHYHHSLFYGRDGGKSGVAAKTSTNLQEWLTELGEEYNYVFYKGVWYAYEGFMSIDIVTEEVVTDHPLPNIQKAKQAAKGKIIKYTWENADTHMRSILKMQKQSNYPEYGIQVFVTPTEVKIQHLEQYVSNYRKQVVVQDTNKLVILTIPTNQFYQETQTSNTPKSQTMEVIRTILYQHINIALEEFTK